jgi:hypothetical protein
MKAPPQLMRNPCQSFRLPPHWQRERSPVVAAAMYWYSVPQLLDRLKAIQHINAS